MKLSLGAEVLVHVLNQCAFTKYLASPIRCYAEFGDALSHKFRYWRSYRSPSPSKKKVTTTHVYLISQILSSRCQSGKAFDWANPPEWMSSHSYFRLPWPFYFLVAVCSISYHGVLSPGCGNLLAGPFMPSRYRQTGNSASVSSTAQCGFFAGLCIKHSNSSPPQTTYSFFNHLTFIGTNNNSPFIRSI